MAARLGTVRRIVDGVFVMTCCPMQELALVASATARMTCDLTHHFGQT